MRLYTKTGDNGTTALATGQRVAKTDARLEAYGTVEELNSHVGLLIVLAPEHREMLTRVQRLLFAVGAVLAGAAASCDMAAEAAWIEHSMDAMQLPPWRGFTLPGGTQAAAQCHVCRTVCRRAERCILDVPDTDRDVRICINRLSDLFYALALTINREAGMEETYY